MEQYLSAVRWFGGKGRPFAVAAVRPLPWLSGEGETPRVRIELVTVAYDRGGSGADSETYQLPLAYYDKPQEHLDHAMVGTWTDDDLGEVFVYDALHDHEATPLLLHGFAEEQAVDGLRFYRVADHDLDVEARSAVLSAEQSNSSVAFGEDSLMKVFRKITAGRNPDIEIHEALTRAGSENVAALYGWLEVVLDQGHEPVQLAMLQQFLRTASDGWELGLTSVRDLYADPDVSPADAGGDFAAEAHRLGGAVAEVHLALADAFPKGTVALDDLADAMSRRVDAAVSVAPGLAEHAAALRARFDAVRALGTPLVVQRIHGDLHLGQTLRTVKGWKLVDFEGEPAKALADRVEPDSPWRDVAGMLRSFDYAAHILEEPPADSLEPREHRASRAAAWAERNRNAFLDGYREVTGHDGRGEDTEPAILVAAYEADKAVYEVVYETRNRPEWVWIPLEAIDRLTAQG
jgi:maltokinase